MKFLLDSHLSPRVAHLLHGAGVNAVHVRDHNLQHSTDSMILDFARRHGFVLVSEDTDFGNCWPSSAW
jgi:predicted nuclease of predicted toxin-antitoxin system